MDAVPTVAGPPGRFLVDSMIPDQLVASDDLQALVTELVRSGTVDIVRTHVQADENAETPDEAKRARLLSLELPEIPTAVFVVDHSRLDRARLGTDEENHQFGVLRGDNPKNTNDAILGATALSTGRILVTDDEDLRSGARALGATVWYGRELVAYLRSLGGDAARTG